MPADIATIGPFAGWQAAQEDTRANNAQNIQNDLMRMQIKETDAGAEQRRGAAYKAFAEGDFKNFQVHQLQTLMGATKARQEARVKAAQTQPGQQTLQQQAAGQPEPGSVPQALFDETFAEIEDLQGAGMYKEAGTLLQKFSMSLRSQSSITRDTAATKKTAIETEMLQGGFLASMMPTVKDEKSWREALMMYQTTFGQPVPKEIQSRPYDPALVEQIRLGGIKAVDQAKIKMQQARTDSQIATDKARRDHLKFNENFTNMEKRASAVAKGRSTALGDDSLTPTAKDVARIHRALIGADYTSMDPVVADAKARELIVGTRALMKKVPGMTSAEAEKSVWADMKKNDQYLQHEEKKKNGNDPSYPIEYEEGTPLKDGKYYTLDGKLYQYENSMFGKGKMIEVDTAGDSVNIEDEEEPETADE